MIRRLYTLSFAVLLVTTPLAVADCFDCVQSQPNGDVSDSNGQPGGALSVDATLLLDSISNVTGGLDQDSALLGNFDRILSLDTHRAFSLPRGRVFLYFLGNFGEAPSRFVGDLQTADNIEAYETIKLYEAWYEQQFDQGKVSLLVGLHDYNSEFYTLEYAGNLLNSSFGVGAELAQVGPSIFPTTALATRLKLLTEESLYLLGAVYDGVPGDATNPRGTHVILDADDGVFLATELGILGSREAGYYKAAFGFWHVSSKFSDFDGEERSNAYGLYFIGEKSLLKDESDGTELGVFFQLGAPVTSRHEIGRYVGFGASLSGLISGRPDDVLSLGLARAEIDRDYRESNRGVLSAETAIEFNYRWVLRPNLILTPDVQWILNPGAAPGVDDALLLGVRVELSV